MSWAHDSDIAFATGSADLDDHALVEVRGLAERARVWPASIIARLEVTTIADSTEDTLARSRAEAVASRLISLGVDSREIEIVVREPEPDAAAPRPDTVEVWLLVPGLPSESDPARDETASSDLPAP